MPWLRNLVRTGDSIMVTIPAPIARRWAKAGAVAVLWELEGNTLRATPQAISDHHYRPARLTLEEDANGTPHDKS